MQIELGIQISCVVLKAVMEGHMSLSEIILSITRFLRDLLAQQTHWIAPSDPQSPHPLCEEF
jgi:hypothetical protein